MMRTSFVVTLMVMMMAGSCLTSADSPVIPDLTGNWTGTCIGHEREGGYNSTSEWLLFLSITEQRDRTFNGTLSYQKKSEDKITGNEGFSGAIGPDMKALYLAEYGGGYSIGEIINPDTLEFIYLQSGEEGSAAIDTFTREKK